ncbi:amidohydrolase family protein [Natrialbaceae archaeon A-chndr2]
MSSKLAFVVRNGRLPTYSGLVDVVVKDGVIANIEDADGADVDRYDDGAVFDAEGGLLSPGFVDGHMHLDMAYAAESRSLDWNEESLDADRFHSLMNEYYADQTVSSLADNAERAIRTAVANGTTHLRTHAMVDLDPGLDTLRALLQAKESTSHLADVQIVPYASRGILAEGNGELVEEAIELALDVAGADDIRVGGMDPAGRNRAIERTQDRWFEVAIKYDVGLDVHLQDGGTAGTYILEEFLDRVESHDYEGRVTVSHGFCLGHIPEWQSEGLAERLVDLDVGIVTCYTSAPVDMPLRTLNDAGVTVGHGTDNTCDFGFPHGTPDSMLGAFVQLIKLRGSPVDNADVGWFGTNPGVRLLLMFLTEGGADVLDIDRYGLDVGSAATFVVFDESTREEAILRRATPQYVFKHGRLVAREREIVE